MQHGYDTTHLAPRITCSHTHRKLKQKDEGQSKEGEENANGVGCTRDKRGFSHAREREGQVMTGPQKRESEKRPGAQKNKK